MAKRNKRQIKKTTSDGYNNFTARVGRNSTNLSGSGEYTLNYTSRNQQALEKMYRSSFLVGKAVDAKAEDMTRKGVFISSGADNKEQSTLNNEFLQLNIWQSLESAIKWGDLYGGAIAVILIDGQDPKTPLRVDTVGKDQFKGLLVFDRWQIHQTANELITDFTPDYGKREYYEIISGQVGVPDWKIHHTRVIRFDGDKLPYRQQLYENGWGQSVIERIVDRIEAYDSVTSGSAQLIYKAHLRTYSIEGLRKILAMPDDMPAFTALMKHMDMIRSYQSVEGMTLMDSLDKFETHSYAFGGLADVMDKFGEQIAGATGIPLIRLLGQSPKGFSTGDADLANYYDEINSLQEKKLRVPVQTLFEVCYRSLFGKELPEDFNFEFNSLWQMSNVDKSTVAVNTINSVIGAVSNGLMSQETGMNEIKTASRYIGIGSNITEEEINNARDEPLPPEDDDSSSISATRANNNPIRNTDAQTIKKDRVDSKWGIRWFRSKRQ